MQTLAANAMQMQRERIRGSLALSDTYTTYD